MEEEYPYNGHESSRPQTKAEFFERFKPQASRPIDCHDEEVFRQWAENALKEGLPYEVEDDVNSPNHYRLFPDAEVIDIIESYLTEEEFIGYMKGNTLKYRLRAGNKDDAMKDIAKADWYRDEIRAKYEEFYGE